MRNQKGFTLAEMVVGIALMGILGMVAASFFVFTAKTKNEITNEIEEKVDNIIAERMLLKDLKLSEPSFNNLVVVDDRGHRFFDFITDMTESGLDTGERILTLEYGRRNEFTFLITRERVSESMMYAPAAAYDIGAPSGNPNVASDISFRSLNKNKAVELSKAAFWQIGSILMLDSPAAVRAMTATGPDYSRPARSPIFLGVVTTLGESRLTPLAFSIPNFLDTTHPMYPSETVNSEDAFFRDIPPMGGAAPLVRLKSVSVVKYYLEKDKEGKVNLLRSVYSGATFPKGQLFAADISRVQFKRNDAHAALIYYMIERPDKKGN
ncbi:prepilin-type N-terminal cleavage/methylation domain-containing protein [Bdellovibrio sp. BCCA]|uniref:prepilin-type N-terminal cleavage/methylation domain-containing protein n=1 Tax=unclassified Bdellovibrio TaxID=2633795 RepID=UPI0025E89554|nr:prepilin-type N-terminal cleavage/methylation domain-containing protein [uncultured Bdellovibrio sp.]